MAQLKCVQCKNFFDSNEITNDRLCFDCSNLDPNYVINNVEIIKKLIESSLDKLAKAKKVSSEKLKNDLVNEHMIEQAIIKKKNESNNN